MILFRALFVRLVSRSAFFGSLFCGFFFAFQYISFVLLSILSIQVNIKKKKRERSKDVGWVGLDFRCSDQIFYLYGQKEFNMARI